MQNDGVVCAHTERCCIQITIEKFITAHIQRVSQAQITRVEAHTHTNQPPPREHIHPSWKVSRERARWIGARSWYAQESSWALSFHENKPASSILIVHIAKRALALYLQQPHVRRARCVFFVKCSNTHIHTGHCSPRAPFAMLSILHYYFLAHNAPHRHLSESERRRGLQF